ncbi:MAG TPA: hypothetical protein VKF60_10985 [Myxococcota bacterium]|nr:hypothetical protein [Myxococcota bacterium]
MTRAARALVIPLLAAACATPVAPAPTPAAAPAPAERGFRAATPQGVELFYDPHVRSYGVSGQPGVYWLDGRFFRRVGADWETSQALGGPWRACSRGELPEGLSD